MANDTPSHWAARLQTAWLQRGPLAMLLWPVSCLYRVLWLLRTVLYRLGLKTSTRLPVPVVVVGNVVVGGAGKTPTVIEIVRHLQARGWRPGIVSRGHGRQGETPVPVTADSSPAEVGDEPRLLSQATGVPLVAGHDRAQAGLKLLALYPEVNLIVSDDGMQHWRLARDLTVVVFDARGTGNGWLLPAGLLREPWPARPWGDGPLLVLQTSGTRLVAGPWPSFVAHRALATEAVNALGQRRTLAQLAADGHVGALAGIAQPTVFFTMLRQQGLQLAYTLTLPDHASASALAHALASHPHTGPWLCTEKDAVKLFRDFPGQPPTSPQLWAVPLQQPIEPAFFSALDSALPAAPPHHPPAVEALSLPHGHQTP